jgi:hypothetical protein
VRHQPTTIMPLLVPDLVEPQSKKTETQDKKEDKATQTTTADKPTTTQPEHKTVDGRTAPGMEGMSDEAVRKFEEAMELEYQKREGGA